MQDFPANSQQAKATDAPREKLEPVTSAEAVRRKRGLGRQFKDTFMGGDARGASEYVFMSVVVPAIRDLVYDAFHGYLERIVYGDSAKPRRGMGSMGSMGTQSNAGFVAYNRMNNAATRSQDPAPRMLSRSARARHNLDELIIPSRQEANEVIDRLFDLLSRYGTATVADLYELTGIQSNHTDMKWGWTNLRGAKAVRMRQGGFLLDLPEPEPLG